MSYLSEYIEPPEFSHEAPSTPDASAELPPLEIERSDYEDAERDGWVNYDDPSRAMSSELHARMRWEEIAKNKVRDLTAKLTDAQSRVTELEQILRDAQHALVSTNLSHHHPIFATVATALAKEPHNDSTSIH